MLPSSTHPRPRVTLKSSLQALRQTFADLRADIDRYMYIDGDQYHWLVLLLTRQGLWVSTQYRISRWVHFYFRIPGFRPLLKLFCALWQKLIEVTTGVEIPNRAQIGGGLFMPHANGIIVHIDAQIGCNCNLSQQVTIGVGGRGTERGTPLIGERTFIGPGAKIFGPITIGNDVAIGANAVVLKDLPDCVVAVGVPAKVISQKGSSDFVLYRSAVNQRSPQDASVAPPPALK